MKLLQYEDLKALALGCGLLGSGGGGNPANDLLIAQYALKTYGPVELLSLNEIANDVIVIPIAFMGAPLIATEKLPSGREFETIIENVTKHGKKIVLMCAEIGGANGLCTLAIAAKMRLPVLDADTVGRAFPQLQMSSCNLHGVSTSLSYFADSLGNLVTLQAKNSKALERIGRHISISMGSSCAIAMYLMDGKKAKTSVISGTVSLALKLGREIIDSKKVGIDPCKSIIELMQGEHLIKGVVTDVSQEIKDGFLQGRVVISTGLRQVELKYQNEFLLAQENNEVIATTPDILTLIESESKIPITTDALRYGLKVDLICLSSPKIWTTKAGLALVGPKVFGYDVDYKPIIKKGKKL